MLEDRFSWACWLMTASMHCLVTSRLTIWEASLSSVGRAGRLVGEGVEGPSHGIGGGVGVGKHQDGVNGHLVGPCCGLVGDETKKSWAPSW